MKYLSIVFLFSNLNNFALASCIINSYRHIFQISSSLDKNIIIDSNCSAETQSRFISFISNTNGKLNEHILNNNMQGKEIISLSPSIITIHHLQALLNKQLLDKDLTHTNLNHLGGRKYLYSQKIQPEIEVKCLNCTKVGNKNISLKIDNKLAWLKSNLKKRSTGFQATQAISYSSPILRVKDFEKISFLTDEPDNIFFDIKNIHFFRPTKNIKPYEILRTRHLVPKNIVSRGQKIRIYIKNKFVNINTIGIAMKSGSIGQYIEVQNPKSKKTTLAKIIDYNKVSIEL